MLGILCLEVSFDSCMRAMSMLLFDMKCDISDILVFMPLAFNCRILREEEFLDVCEIGWV